MSTNRTQSPAIEYEYQRILAQHKALNPMLFASEEVGSTKAKKSITKRSANALNRLAQLLSTVHKLHATHPKFIFGGLRLLFNRYSM